MTFPSVATFVAALVCATSAWATVVSDWNAAALQEVRKSKALRNGPPMVARALAIAHTCMYDAWAAYDEFAVGTTDTGSDLLPPGSRRRPAEERTDDNKATAISFAAYLCLRNLYPDAASKVRLDAALAEEAISMKEIVVRSTRPVVDVRQTSTVANVSREEIAEMIGCLDAILTKAGAARQVA